MLKNIPLYYKIKLVFNSLLKKSYSLISKLYCFCHASTANLDRSSINNIMSI